MGERFQQVNTRLNFPELEQGVLELWRETDMFRRSVEEREGCEPFVFLEGPPTANGKPGVHHVLARVMKDVICRYKTMTGHQVHRKGGWDTHGLPVEIEVEKALGLDGKEEIEAYGIREFVEKCKESVLAYEQDWRTITERIGFWLDMDDPYVTFHNDYIESVWSILKRYWDAGLLYQGHKVVPYCPRCGTALSSHEVAQGYAEVEDPSVYVKFRLKDEPDTYFLVWTTTPWTLPSNVALAVKTDAEYARVRHDGETWIVAKALVEPVLSDLDGYEVVEGVMGSELVGVDYEPLFDFAKPREKAYYVVAADFVTLDDGTGIVHLAPAFGQDDYDVGREHGLPVVQLVNTEGAFVDSVTPWAGAFVKDADPAIIDDLRSRGQMLRAEKYTHDYPFCWRCDTPLLYYARASWFIKTTDFKDRMVELNQTVNWHPGHIKEGRFGDWLENNIDWAISRERYWGTPLPIWRCTECDHARCVGSIAELKAAAPDTPDDIELHRPYIDEVEMSCDECGGVMKRVPEVADAWLDSGCAHTAQWHAPFENGDHAARAYPADFISEAIDQTRGWFYSLLATGAFLYDEPAYKNCLCLELVMGADGLKMSKTRGNMVDPWTVLDKHGADATRWYFYTVAPPWQQRAFSEETVGESLKKFLGTLYNVYGFFVLYANADDIDPTVDVTPPADRPLMDRWALSRYNSLARTVRRQMDEYQITAAARAIEAFVDELSNWYVRRGRDRFWGSADKGDTRDAFATLYELLVGVSKLLAPFAPFVSEAMYQNLVKSFDADTPAGVHLEDFPTADESLIDEDLEAAMGLTRRVVTMGRAARNDGKIRTRQPLSRLVVGGLTPIQREHLDGLRDAVLDELNVKDVAWADDLSAYATYEAKANFRALGPKFGKAVQAVAKAVADADAEALQASLKTDGEARVAAGGDSFTLDAGDVEVSLQSRDGFAVVSEGAVFVALDTRITDELEKEGRVREWVTHLQQERRTSGLHVSDRAMTSTSMPAGSPLLEAYLWNPDYVMEETLMVHIDVDAEEIDGANSRTILGQDVPVHVVAHDGQIDDLRPQLFGDMPWWSALERPRDATPSAWYQFKGRFHTGGPEVLNGVLGYAQRAGMWPDLSARLHRVLPEDVSREQAARHDRAVSAPLWGILNEAFAAMFLQRGLKWELRGRSPRSGAVHTPDLVMIAPSGPRVAVEVKTVSEWHAGQGASDGAGKLCEAMLDAEAKLEAHVADVDPGGMATLIVVRDDLALSFAEEASLAELLSPVAQHRDDPGLADHVSAVLHLHYTYSGGVELHPRVYINRNVRGVAPLAGADFRGAKVVAEDGYVAAGPPVRWSDLAEPVPGLPSAPHHVSERG